MSNPGKTTLMQEKPLLVTILSALILVLLSFPGSLSIVLAKTTPPAPEDMVKAVNNLRSLKNIPEFRINKLLMSSAQGHAEYLASIGKFSSTGAGKTDETDRALAAGYGDSTGTVCGEAVAIAQSATNVDYIVTNVWNDAKHRDLVLLNSDFKDIGVGIGVDGEGIIYYVVDTCTKNDEAAVQTPGTRRTGTLEVEVIPVTPKENGAVVHVVATGETLWSIANAYNMTTDQILLLNNLKTPDTMIYVGQKLLLRAANTPTLSPTVTQTPRPPTRTSRPTFTQRPAGAIETATPEPTSTRLPPIKAPEINRRWLGIGLVVLCVLGLLSVWVSGMRPKSPDQSSPGERPDDKKE